MTDQLFVQPERLVWLSWVGVAVLAILFGEVVRARWRRRLFALAEDHVDKNSHERGRWISSAMRVLALMLVALALADPRFGVGAIEVKASKLQLVCLLDRSRSMLAQDIAPSRFEVGKSAIRNAMDRAGGGAVALVTFAGQPRVDVPLTRDYQGLLDRLETVVPGESDTHGTNLGQGLVTAAGCFAERIESPKVLLVISDGETHGHEPELPPGTLAESVEVWVLGVGTREGARIPVGDPAAPDADDADYFTFQGDVIRSKANPELLERLSDRLGGKFQQIDADSAADTVAAVLRQAASSVERETRLAYQRQLAPQFHWLLLVAIGLLGFESVLPRSLPTGFSETAPRSPPGRRRLLVCILLPALVLSAAWSDAPAGAPAESPPTKRELRELYNRGVEAYRDGQWNDAEDLFRAVSRHAEGSLRSKAQFNLGNTLYAIADRGGISREEAIAGLEAAIELFRHNIADGRRTADARANAEIAYRRLWQIRQQPADSQGDGSSPPADEPPDGPGDPPGENDDEPDESPHSAEPPPPDGSDADGGDRRSPGDDQPSGTDETPARPPNEPSVPERDGPPDSGRSGATIPERAPTAPLSDEQAEDQLRRIRQRARDGRGDREGQAPEDAAAAVEPPGLPW